MAKRRVALVAWELGAGRGHLEHLRPVVEGLLRAGWTVLAAVRDLAGGHAVLGSIDPRLRGRRFAIGQAPIFLHRAGPAPGRPGSLAEILVRSGFGDAALVRPVVETWDALLASVRPSVILADFAPSVVAASRGRIPVVMTGNGWTIPPDGSPIPALPISGYDAGTAACAEARICSVMEEVSAEHWRPARFADLLRADSRFIYTAPMLDPYRTARRDDCSWPPNLAVPPAASTPAAAYALAYLPRRHQAIGAVLDALRTAGVTTYAYFGGLLPDTPPNVMVSAAPIDFGVALPRARVVIHHGGLGVANWCLSHRRPQVVLPIDLEKHLIAQALDSKGIGVAVSTGADPAQIAAAISRGAELMPPPGLSSGLRHHSPTETIEAVVRACEAAATGG